MSHQRLLDLLFRTLGALSLLVPAASSAGGLGPGSYSRGFVHDSIPRSYELLVPGSYDGTALPLVIDIHGAGSAPLEQKAISGYRLLAQSEGFIVAFPAGIEKTFNGGICCGAARAMMIDDIGFIETLAGDVASVVAVDASRIYATGLSNGGAMSHRLGCEASDFFAAIAPAAFPVPFFPMTDCQPSRPMPIHFTMGRTDTVVDFSSAQPSLEHWLAVNGCVTKEPDSVFVSGEATCETYSQCDGGVEVEFCSMVADERIGGSLAGHVLYVNRDINIGARGWALMSKYSTDPPPVLVPEPTAGQLAAAVLPALALARRAHRRGHSSRAGAAGRRDERKRSPGAQSRKRSRSSGDGTRQASSSPNIR